MNRNRKVIFGVALLVIGTIVLVVSPFLLTEGASETTKALLANMGTFGAVVAGIGLLVAALSSNNRS